MKFVDLDKQLEVIDGEVREAIDRVLDHKQFIMGPEVAVLEQELSEYCGAKKVISAASGTDALLMALMAYGIGPGDAVIAPPFTFVATAEVIELLGATTVFVDVEETTFNINPAELERTIEAVKSRGDVKLKGIIPVDIFGIPADYDAILPIAQKHGLFVLCDAAQSFGAKYKDQKVGSIGEVSATSFFPAKPLGCYGDGGAVFTNNTELAETLESIRFHGKGATQYENVRIGITGRMDTIQAAILSCKLKIFDDELTQRQVIADRYNLGLQDNVITPLVPAGSTSAWAVYTIRSPHRDKIKATLQEKGVPCAVYYPAPLHRQPAFQNAIGAGQPMPVSDKLSEDVISLPIHPYLSVADQNSIIEIIDSVIP
jgi:dTDP-4-amino-4,6-dideoxygalactose transaminase